MENEKIAKLVSTKIYNVNDDITDFAMQLLVEKLVLPLNIEIYTAETLYEYILKTLNK